MNVARAETRVLAVEPGTSTNDARKGKLLITVLRDASGQLDGAIALHLTIAFAQDGSAQAHGVIHLPDTNPPAVLVATGAALVVSDDRGITGLVLEGWHPSEARVAPPIGITLTTERPIAASGIYDIDLTVGNTSLAAVQLFVQFLGPRDVTAATPRALVSAAGRRTGVRGGPGRRPTAGRRLRERGRSTSDRKPLQ